MQTSDPPAGEPVRVGDTKEDFCPECLPERVPFIADNPDKTSDATVWRCRDHPDHHTELGILCRAGDGSRAKARITLDCALCRVCIAAVVDCADESELEGICQGWTPPLPDLARQRLIREHCQAIVNAGPFLDRRT